MGSYMEEWQTATQKWNNRRLLRREQHLHWVGWSDAGADGIFCAAPQINRSWHMEDRRQGVLEDNIPWCALKRSADGETKTRMCEKWTLHFFKVPPLTASYSFYICGRMPRGSLSMILQDSLGMMCMLWRFSVSLRWGVGGGQFFFGRKTKAMIKSPLSPKLSEFSQPVR